MIKLALAQMNSTVGDFEGNLAKMRNFLREAPPVDLIVFPECNICGYPAQDLIDYPNFAEKSEQAAQQIVSEFPNRTFLFGSVERNSGPGKPCRNVAILARAGKIEVVYAKRLLPTYDVFDEDRFFEPGQKPFLFELKGKRIGVTVCEDLWSDDPEACLQNRYAQNPLSDLGTIDLHVNLSASPFEAKKVEFKRQMLQRIAERYQTPLVYVNSTGANDALIFDGRTYVWSGRGELIGMGAAFREDLIVVDLAKPQSIQVTLRDEIEEVYDALVVGIQDYCRKQKFETALVGLSGGIDSAVVACLAADALGAENVTGVLLPSRFTSAESTEDALALAKALQNPIDILAIEEAYQAMRRTLEKTFEGKAEDTTEENLQSRIRGILMMALSNKFGNLLLTTGNKSELAVGYSTLYGDMCGGLAPLADVYKMQVYELAREANRRKMRIPERCFTKAPTAELKPNQTDQDMLPPYEELDKILKALIEGRKATEEIVAEMNLDRRLVQKVAMWLQRAEYKRFQMPLGLKVSPKAFGIGRRIPIVNRFFSA